MGIGAHEPIQRVVLARILLSKWVGKCRLITAPNVDVWTSAWWFASNRDLRISVADLTTALWCGVLT